MMSFCRLGTQRTAAFYCLGARLLSGQATSTRSKVTPDRPHAMGKPERLLKPAIIHERLLMGAGPGNMTPVIAASQTQPLVGLLHPELLQIMDDVKSGLQYVFQTENAYTFAVSGTGHAGMECAIVNLLESNEKLLVVRNGIWGKRVADLGERIGAHVKCIEVEPGEVASFEQIKMVPFFWH
ncbi:hypothetical protein AB6A40_010439 [Gnathostoma spinigerum]|uniref:Alanine-glyoxylate aminotransferase n=1 Tax=Gnathostoma spinigerum TaxID=75299 RepID=A0ABD6F3A9_9BILA